MSYLRVSFNQLSQQVLVELVPPKTALLVLLGG